MVALMATAPDPSIALIDGVIGREGGYTNHPADRGGPTRWGVTEQRARAFGYTGDMKVYPRESAVAVFRTGYWIEPGFYAVWLRYPEVAAELFDIGVNMGVAVAGAFLQRGLNVFNQEGAHYGDLTVDGQLGRLSITALDAFRQRRGEEGGERMLELVRSLRGARYVEICEARPTQEAFAYGWFGRMVEMLTARQARLARK